MLGPATYRADAPATFIHPLDDAWDRKRIDRERKAIMLRNVELATDLDDDEAKSRMYRAHLHPWDAYQAGRTRYDLGAKLRLFVPGRLPSAAGKTEAGAQSREPDTYVEITVAEYLTGEPTEFHLKRLPRDKMNEIGLALAPRAKRTAEVANLSAVEAWCLVGQDEERATQALYEAAKAGTGKTLDELHALASDLPKLLGRAVVSYSGPPREHELFLSA